MFSPVSLGPLHTFPDDSLWQRETTFIPQQVMQGACQIHKLSSLIKALKCITVNVLLLLRTATDDYFSSQLGHDTFLISRPRGFAPVEPIEKYHVVFPLARPTSQNIRSICLHGNRRPRYPESYFPSSGFGVSKREGDAVNTLEAWFGTCCGQDQTEEKLLCCATQAWEKSINHFCEVGFRIKTTHFHCCKRNRSERLPCFDREAPNPDYNPTEESAVEPVAPDVEFNFDPTSYGRREKKGKKPAMPIELDLDFPLAAPTDSNIESICRNRKLRPHYNIKCLKGLDLAALQAKSINSLEKYFKICCRNKERILSCAQTSVRYSGFTPVLVLELFQATCSSKKSPPSVKRCCRLSSAECFNKVLMDAITKATSRPRKKICPVS
uniref:Extracellular matrix protein 1b n=1 Tax=Periophthalmus magnuspinnatus TaxID=409849 RepID=A0A3B4A1I9_9GOBI